MSCKYLRNASLRRQRDSEELWGRGIKPALPCHPSPAEKQLCVRALNMLTFSGEM